MVVIYVTRGKGEMGKMGGIVSGMSQRVTIEVRRFEHLEPFLLWLISCLARRSCWLGYRWGSK